MMYFTAFYTYLSVSTFKTFRMVTTPVSATKVIDFKFPLCIAQKIFSSYLPFQELVTSKITNNTSIYYFKMCSWSKGFRQPPSEILRAELMRVRITASFNVCLLWQKNLHEFLNISKKVKKKAQFSPRFSGLFS